MSEGKNYPVSLSMPHPARPSRLLALATLLLVIKPIMLIPHFIILYILGICATLAGAIAQAVVLFTGKYPRGMFALVKVTMQWQLRMNSYFYGLTDEYPPFELDVEDKQAAWKTLWWMIGIAVVLFILFLVFMSSFNFSEGGGNMMYETAS